MEVHEICVVLLILLAIFLMHVKLIYYVGWLSDACARKTRDLHAGMLA